MKFVNLLSASSLFVLTLAAFSSSYAAVDLSEVVSDALPLHPEVREKIQVYRQVLNDQFIAESSNGPSIDVEGSVGLYNTDAPATANSSNSYDSSRVELSLTQNLFNGYDSLNQIKQTKSRSQSSLYDIYDTTDNVTLDIVQSFISVLKQRKLTQLALFNVSAHEDILSQIRERHDSGVGRRSQLQQTEGRVARAYGSLVAQQNNLRDSVTQLHFVLGRYIDPDALSEPDFPALPTATLNELIDVALISHPALWVANHNINASRFDYKRSLAAKYPNINVELATEAGYDIGGVVGDRRETRVVVNLTYNLYNGGATKARQQQKVSSVHEQKDFYARVRRQVINTLRLAWIGDNSLSKQLVYLDQHVVKATETVSSYKEEFFIGQRNLIDLLDAENELNSAKSQQAESYYDSLAARYRIYEGIGQLLQILDLNIDMNADNLIISKLEQDIIVANQQSTLPVPKDIDADEQLDVLDHCDNTVIDSTINAYGCADKGLVDLKDVPVKALEFEVMKATAIDDSFTIESGSILIISQQQLLLNDIPGDGNKMTFLNASEPDSGQLAFDKDKNIIYRAEEGFVGEDLFEYTVTNKKQAPMKATVRIDVKEVGFVDLNKLQYVNFLSGKTTLTKVSAANVEKIITAIRSEDKVSIKIYTHTDSIGSDSYNLKLSKRRAKALKQELVDKGINAADIQAIGMGEKHPVADNDTKAGQAINRRGEFIFKLETKEQINDKSF